MIITDNGKFKVIGVDLADFPENRRNFFWRHDSKTGLCTSKLQKTIHSCISIFAWSRKTRSPHPICKFSSMPSNLQPMLWKKNAEALSEFCLSVRIS